MNFLKIMFFYILYFSLFSNLVVRESQVRDTTLVSPTTLATKASTTEEPHTSGELLARLRRFMRDTNIIGIPIDAYIVPSRDEHNVSRNTNCFFSNTLSVLCIDE